MNLKKSVMRLVSQCQIDDCQHHEDECLQGYDQQVEDSPTESEYELTEPSERRADVRRPPRRQRDQSDQDHDELAGVHVAEESQAEGYGPRQLLDALQDEIEPGQPDRVERVKKEFLRISADALHLDAVELHENEHGECHAQRDVEVRR